LIPLGALVTDPFPKPDKETVNEIVLEFSLLKVATADCGVTLLIKIRHTPAPEQSPFQLARTEPEAGFGVRLTCVPAGKVAEQVFPQLIPDGELVMVPDPVPSDETDSCPDGNAKSPWPDNKRKAKRISSISFFRIANPALIPIKSC
jgi:hypothetical protein